MAGPLDALMALPMFSLPDLPPWFDDESDDEDEVACDDVDMAYDE